MSCGVEVPLDICPGKTFSRTFRWGQSRKAYKPIVSATQAAPCVITVTAHGMPDGWAYQVTGAKGMTELNTAEEEYRQAIKLTADTLEINELDAHQLAAYVASSGMLSYDLPVDLTGFTARMQIRRAVADVAFVLELTTANGGIVIDVAACTITLTATAAATAALPEMEAVYDLELVSGGGIVYLLAYGAVVIDTEVTR